MSIQEKLKALREKRKVESPFKEVTEQISDWIELGDYFEEATGGKGFPCGHITTVLGKTDSGKTTIIMEGMIFTQKSGGIVYFIDSEHKFSKDRFRLMGGTPEDIQFIPTDTLEESWDAVQYVLGEVKALREEGFDGKIMLVWDSVAASVPKAVGEEKESGKAHMAVEAKLNNKLVRKHRQAIRELNIAMVVINHFYMTVPSNPYERPELIIKHGEEWSFFSTLILLHKKGAKITRKVGGDDQQIGRVCRIETMKSHCHGRTKIMEVNIVDKGIVSDEELEAYQKSLRGKL